MTSYAVLLRAINVGGHNKIPMAELRALLAELKFDNVATYIQSGNIVCSSRKKAPAVAKEFKTGIADRFGHDIAAIVRTADEIADIIERFPYANADPKTSGVVFLSDEFKGDLDDSEFAPATCHVAGADVFMSSPNGFSDTKLTPAWIEKQTGLVGTRRNWATVIRLHDMLTSF